MISLILIILVTKKKGSLPISISEIAYILPSWIFTALMTFLGMLAFYFMIESSEKTELITFAFGVGMFMVAASPYYRSEVKLYT